MFGYAVPVDMTLSGADAAAYRGYYCETCHQLRDCYGVMSAIIVSYEMAFASILLNSVSSDGVDVSEPKAGPLCVLRHSSRRTELLRKLAAYSVLVANNDLIDDRLDGATVKTNLGLLWMNRSIERARRDFPEYTTASSWTDTPSCGRRSPPDAPTRWRWGTHRPPAWSVS